VREESSCKAVVVFVGRDSSEICEEVPSLHRCGVNTHVAVVACGEAHNVADNFFFFATNRS
jgi:hypothetical protein